LAALLLIQKYIGGYKDKQSANQLFGNNNGDDGCVAGGPNSLRLRLSVKYRFLSSNCLRQLSRYYPNSSAGYSPLTARQGMIYGMEILL